MKMRVSAVLRMSPQMLWECREHEIQVNYLAYRDYFRGRSVAYGLVMDEVVPITEEVYREELGLNGSPQWFAYVCKLGKLAK